MPSLDRGEAQDSRCCGCYWRALPGASTNRFRLGVEGSKPVSLGAGAVKRPPVPVGGPSRSSSAARCSVITLAREAQPTEQGHGSAEHRSVVAEGCSARGAWGGQTTQPLTRGWVEQAEAAIPSGGEGAPGRSPVASRRRTRRCEPARSAASAGGGALGRAGNDSCLPGGRG